MMILIDASNVNVGGGKILLEYLLDELIERKIDFFLLRDARWNSYERIKPLQSIVTSIYNRKKDLKTYTKLLSPKAIFCFGNFPPPLKLPCKTITYFQNPNLLDNIWEQTPNDRLFFLKKLYLKRYLKNTDFVVFQNNKILEHFKKVFGCFASSGVKYLEIPFFDEKKIIQTRKNYQNATKKSNSFIYVSLPHKHKNHSNLLHAWGILASQNYFPELTLTVPINNSPLTEKIITLKENGVKINNLGIIPFSEALERTAETEFCIYPSLKETFGLGLIESALLGCKVIAADLDYVYEVLKPSLVFDPLNPTDIVEKVKLSLQKDIEIEKTIPLIQNNIEMLINLLIN